jgi:hypothetical protein
MKVSFLVLLLTARHLLTLAGPGQKYLYTRIAEYGVPIPFFDGRSGGRRLVKTSEGMLSHLTDFCPLLLFFLFVIGGERQEVAQIIPVPADARGLVQPRPKPRPLSELNPKPLTSDASPAMEAIMRDREEK